MAPSQQIAASLEAAVLRAAAHVVSIIDSGSPIGFETKPDNTLVTNLDLEANRVILAELGGGSIPAVSEENPTTHGALQSASEYLLIDPIDGTTSCKRFTRLRDGQVGFGPIAGYVRDRRLEACAFFHIPNRTLYTARVGGGAWARRYDDGVTRAEEEAVRLAPALDVPLAVSAMLFYPGRRGEVTFMDLVQQSNLIETAYRFGGFANDCVRAAHGYEQIVVQFSLKPWDLPAALLASEAGLSVVVDPFGDAVPLIDWELKAVNPVLIGGQAQVGELIRRFRGPISELARVTKA